MLKNIIRRSIIITFTALQIVFFPIAGYAEETTPADTTATTVEVAPVISEAAPATTETTGPSSPTGADNSTFVRNETTGLWENDYYTWDPVTKLTAPKTTLDYSYNPETGRWDTTEWLYDAPSGKYIPNIVEIITPPAGAQITNPGTGDPVTALLNNPAASTAGPGSPVDANTKTTNTGAYDLFYNASISNAINSQAITGNASILSNTTGGSALSGNALTQATVLNMLQSVWNPNSGDIVNFTANINGDVTGDLTIDPGRIPQKLTTASDTNAKLNINVSEDTAIKNNIDLAAISGNATVDSNTTAGDATTGTAAAVANVVNLINSIIGSGQSFVGTVNINGNLNGDILLPKDMLNQLLASNVPRAVISTDAISNGNVLAEFNNNQTINNAVTTDASSGAANVSNNSTAGNASSGAATNNVTILNLTGRDIIGSNAMLVFVNVLGNWVGMIMDAPGATSAVVGGGITSNTVNNLDAVIKTDSSQTITNDIKLAAHTGDANVTNNTRAGNASSGDASTSANIANVSNSKLSLGGWFGVLFINVFGSWLGSFGVNTSAGNPPVTAPSNVGSDIKVFQFVPTTSGSTGLRSVPTTRNLGTAGSSTGQETPSDNGTVLGATTITSPVTGSTAAVNAPNNIMKAYIGLALFTLFMLSAGKLLAFLTGRP